MLTYAVKRIGLGLLILVLVMVAMYAAVFLVPGDPASVALGPRATPRIEAAADRAHGARPAGLVADRRVLPQRADRQSRLRRLVEPAGLDPGHAGAAEHADPRADLARCCPSHRRSARLPVGHAARHAGRCRHRRALGRRHRRAVLCRRHLFAAALCRDAALAAGDRRRRGRRHRQSGQGAGPARGWRSRLAGSATSPAWFAPR